MGTGISFTCVHQQPSLHTICTSVSLVNALILRAKYPSADSWLHKVVNMETTRKPDLVVKHLPMSSEVLFKQYFVVTVSISDAENFQCVLN